MSQTKAQLVDAVDGSIVTADLADNAVTTAKIANNAVTADKIPNVGITFAKIQDVSQNRIVGRISSGSGVLQELTAANVRSIINVADGATNSPAITINTNADNRVITGSDTTNTLNGESTLTFNNGQLDVTQTTSASDAKLVIRNSNTPGSGSLRLEFHYGTGSSEGTDRFRFGFVEGYRQSGSNDGGLKFGTKLDNSSSPSERVRIDNRGRVKIFNQGVSIDHTSNTTNTPLYLETATDLTAVNTGEGGTTTGLFRIHDTNSSNNRYHGIELRNRNAGDFRILNKDTGVNNHGQLVIGMPSSDGSLITKMVFDSSNNYVALSGRDAGALLNGSSTEQVDFYIATKSTITTPGDGAGTNRSGVVRIHDKGSNNNRFVGFEARNRNDGDVRFMNADRAGSNKADAVIVCDSGSNIFENARFLHSGGITFNGDTAAANALDDYEDGTFTPQFMVGGNESSGVNYSSRAGTYTKVGRKVTVNIMFELNNNGSTNGQVEFGNLPFTVADSLAHTSHEATGGVGYMVNMSDSTYYLSVSALQSSSRLMLMGQVSHDTGFDHIQRNQTANNFSVRASCTYFTS